MAKYILSKMSASVNYNLYNLVDGLPMVRHKITVHGGAGIPSARSGFGEMTHDTEGRPLWTADGVVTPVSDEDHALLLDHAVFKKHMDKGYVKVINSDIRGNHKAIIQQSKGMESDGFRQLNPKSLAAMSKVTTTFAKQADEYRL